MVRQSFYDTRRLEHPHSLIRKFKRSPQGPSAQPRYTPRGFKICAYSCKFILNYTQVFGLIWITVPSWEQTITQRLQPPPLRYCAVTKSQHHKAKNTHHPGWRFFFRVKIQTIERQSQEKMEDHLRMSHATTARKWDIIHETSCRKQLTLAQGQNPYRLESAWHKQQPMPQKLTSSILIRSCWTHAPLSSKPVIWTSFKTFMPMIQTKNSGSTPTGFIRIIVTLKPLQCYHSNC